MNFIRRILGQHPKKNWGVIILALWSLILALLTLGNLLILARSAGFFSMEQSRIWLVFILNVFFLISFSLSFYGLWQHHNWGRLLFLWSLGLWATFGLLALFMPNFLSTSARTEAISSVLFNAFRYVASFLFPLLYLNLAHIKVRFQQE